MRSDGTNEGTNILARFDSITNLVSSGNELYFVPAQTIVPTLEQRRNFAGRSLSKTSTQTPTQTSHRIFLKLMAFCFTAQSMALETTGNTLM